MKPIAMFALGLAIAGAATLTFAQARPPAAGKTAHHARLDANGDGVIDRSEAAKAPKFAERFDTLDINKDGRITAEERPQHGMREGKGGREGMREHMQQLDANKDGRFSRDELAGKDRMLQNFAAVDADRDGLLSREEMQAYRKTRHGERGRQPQQK
ncbi:MAG: calcium-binding protein [Lysobacteraceae bacterium]